MANFYEIQHVNQRRFLNAYVKCGQITKAFEEIGMERTIHYKWLRDPVYAKAFEDAQMMVGDLLEAEAVRRAVDGVVREKGVYHQGCRVGTEIITEYSDSLLALLLKAAKPDTYRERIEINVIDRVRQKATEYGLDPDEAVKEVERLLSIKAS